MDEAVYFAVIRWNGRECPRLFYERVPPALLVKGGPILYCTRIDTMPLGAIMVQAPLDMLMATYREWQRRGEVPPEDRGGKPKQKEGETRLSHDHWTPPPVTWDRDAPAYPPLD